MVVSAYGIDRALELKPIDPDAATRFCRVRYGMPRIYNLLKDQGETQNVLFHETWVPKAALEGENNESNPICDVRLCGALPAGCGVCYD